MQGDKTLRVLALAIFIPQILSVYWEPTITVTVLPTACKDAGKSALERTNSPLASEYVACRLTQHQQNYIQSPQHLCYRVSSKGVDLVDTRECNYVFCIRNVEFCFLGGIQTYCVHKPATIVKCTQLITGLAVSLEPDKLIEIFRGFNSTNKQT